MRDMSEDEKYIDDFIREHNRGFILLNHEDMKYLAQKILSKIGYEIIKVEAHIGSIKFEGIHPDLLVKDIDTKEEIAVEVGDINNKEGVIEYLKKGKTLIWIPYPDFDFVPLFSIFIIKNKDVDVDAIKYLNEKVKQLENALNKLREEKTAKIEWIHKQLFEIWQKIREDLK